MKVMECNRTRNPGQETLKAGPRLCMVGPKDTVRPFAEIRCPERFIYFVIY